MRAEVRTNTETPFFYTLLVMKADRFVCNEKEREGGCRDRVFTGNESGRASETFYLCQPQGFIGLERKKVLVSGHIDENKSRR